MGTLWLKNLPPKERVTTFCASKLGIINIFLIFLKNNDIIIIENK